MTNPSALDALTLPLVGTRLIEASAGTGKTFTIAALYVRLILGHRTISSEISHQADTPTNPLLPPDILVVTFTEAATKELRERIRDRLTQAAAYFRQKIQQGDDFLQQLRQEYPEDHWPHCAYKLELAANWMDEAAVYTIHGWCNRMLQQHAFDSGSLFRQEVDNDDQSLLQQVVCDYWRQYFYPLSETATLAVHKLASTPEQLAQCLKNLLFETEAAGLEFADTGIHDAFSAWETWELERYKLENDARQLWRMHQSVLESTLKSASENSWLNGNLYRKASFEEKLSAMAAWAASNESLAIEDLAKFGRYKLQAGLSQKYRDKVSHFEHKAFEALDELVEHCGQELDIRQLIIRHAVHWMRQRYQIEKQRMARMTFDDMLNRLDLALQGPNAEPLANNIRRQYPVAMIDEFQDTDPVQYRIFARLYPAGIETDLACFMIGDPKQAIYSFRGGDIFTYLKAHQATLGRHYTLDTNYRSTQALVTAVNQIFLHNETQKCAGAFWFKTEHYNPLPFLSVNAKGRDEEWIIDDQSAAALNLWHIESDTPIGMPEYRWQMAETTASEIVRLLRSADCGQTGFKDGSGNIRGLQPADIAILVRSGTEAKAMRRALAARQLRSVYLSERESIYASPEATDCLIWLKALADPRNEAKVRAALSTATLGWTYQELLQLTYNEPAWEQQLERFVLYQQRWQQAGILPTLRQLMSDFALPARLNQLTDGERRLTNLLHLAELLQQASSHLEGEQALIRHLAEAMADNAAHSSGDESVIRLESDANLIKIITIHKSKGLEYPLVFLPFICSFREVNSANNRYYRYHDEQLNLNIDLGKADAFKTLSDKERLQEDLRLFYVAITRARFACWLGVAPIKIQNSKHSQLEKSAMGYLLDWQAGMLSGALREQLQKLKGTCTSIAINPLPPATSDCYVAQQQALPTEEVRATNRIVADHWWIASYSALQTENTTAKNPLTSIEAENYREDKQVDETELTPTTPIAGTGIHGLPKGAEAGVLIHELLEQAAQLGFDSVHKQPQLARQLIANLFKTNIWLHQHDILQQSLQRWLQQPLLTHANLSLSKLSKDQYQAELEFLLGVDTVNTEKLDNLLNQYTFSGHPRPRLLPNQLNGLLKGFVDLVFVHDNRYYVVDYKFNSLGSQDAAYHLPALEAAMLDKRYDLQAVLYLLALHRLLKVRLGSHYDYESHIGGSVYLFLRGTQHSDGGRLLIKPPAILIESLDVLFSAESLTEAC
jgi:exodeoxyribonuclease V beta subunit